MLIKLIQEKLQNQARVDHAVQAAKYHEQRSQQQLERNIAMGNNFQRHFHAMQSELTEINRNLVRKF